MRRALWFLGVLIAVVAIMVGVVAQQAVADDRGLQVTVDFDYSGDEGNRCGFFGKGGELAYPDAAQVLISDADGTMVGTLDLRDGLDADYTDDGLPGVVTGEFCRVEADISVPDSAFYTFTILGHYEWTLSRANLEAREWAVPIVFLTSS